ncbi:MAG: rhomboid family intramembrane serine protease [Confluentimicrobium sp.]|jgi:membrane associated rhomboid family serine protease|uniref:Membrane associated rhomboid family serine protease n=1 Tax=Actibacterium naphthalenivorans TaxID=1614693 RepID=A0A840C6Y7_9RHOB|nr:MULTISPECIES: rhomboid family intramembrane serine protease [Actibacterium]KGB83496.1 peptidase C54 [Rhodovulum sp. NI22]MDY6857849.1 rhomboid family intramembrane serine protease [Pseudomonadota bacterium]ALG89516.1 peptidase C54 [Actibacterium sp. EMB200-NS6]MBB4020840.1 membrane associated rhomboid family serine protease [Actibacterium naphthalenivorans]MBC58620.1 rhomboid family intramembrane serine protease [Actibacterium sp.]
MFPIRDHNPSSRTPFVTYALIAVNVVVFVSYWPLFADQMELQRFFYTWALIPAALTEHGVWHGLFTSMFLHGGLMHLIGNMVFLWIFGDNLEDELGHGGFLGFYLVGGLAASLFQILAAPHSPVPVVGASGAIAAVMGGYLLMFPRARVDVLFIFIIFFRIFPLPAWVLLGVWFGLQIFSGASTPADGGGVAYWAHAGGFAAGLVMMLPSWLRRGGPGYWSRTHGLPPHPEKLYRRTTIPVVRRRR